MTRGCFRNPTTLAHAVRTVDTAGPRAGEETHGRQMGLARQSGRYSADLGTGIPRHLRPMPSPVRRRPRDRAGAPLNGPPCTGARPVLPHCLAARSTVRGRRGAAGRRAAQSVAADCAWGVADDGNHASGGQRGCPQLPFGSSGWQFVARPGPSHSVQTVLPEGSQSSVPQRSASASIRSRSRPDWASGRTGRVRTGLQGCDAASLRRRA